MKFVTLILKKTKRVLSTNTFVPYNKNFINFNTQAEFDNWIIISMIMTKKVENVGLTYDYNEMFGITY